MLQQEWRCTALQRRIEKSWQPAAVNGMLVHVLFTDPWYTGVFRGSEVQFGDGTMKYKLFYVATACGIFARLFPFLEEQFVALLAQWTRP